MGDCFIFSGQGSHRPGMGLKLYQHSTIAKDKIHLSNQILGYDISDIMFNDNEAILRQTNYAQVAI
ncbi:MAG: acyltransferase domain-containing protein, partial [Candidatus Marinimicrobia bacterium]|nr:acyltransferase domain-containing protein [Candidatus Neomarinimicrobiota bacterium]